jgi:DNA-binding NarL/FixJ family response regulator
MTALDAPCVVLADERAPAREALRDVLEPQFRVAAIVVHGRALPAAVRRFQPAALLLSVMLPGADLFPTLRELAGHEPVVPVLLLTPTIEPFAADQALRAGARGYLQRGASAGALLDAVTTIVGGGVVIDSLLYRQSADDGWGSAPAAGRPVLTDRQRQVLRLVVQGRRTAEIAALLGIGEKAVEFHRGRLKRALGVSTTAALVRCALTRGLVRGERVRRSIPA